MEHPVHENHGSRSAGRAAAVRAAILYSVVATVALNVVVVLIGDRILPDVDTPAGVVVVLVLAAGTGILAGLLFIDFARRTGHGGLDGGALFGAIAAGIGLMIDGAIYLVTGFDFPGLDQGATETFAVNLLLAWGLVALVPPVVGAAMERRTS